MRGGWPRWRSAQGLGNATALLLLLLGLVGLFFLRLQAGDWWVAPPRPERWSMAAAVVAAYALFCLALAWLARRQNAGVGIATAEALSSANRGTIWVVYATQTGYALELAQRTAEALGQAGQTALLCPIDQLDAQRLSQGGTMLFIVSTTGEGDPPDHALGFVRDVMGHPADLRPLHYSILALGDRDYELFCAFGHRLDQWLTEHRAQPLFDLIEVDNADADALQRWQARLTDLGADPTTPLTSRRYETWRLAAREALNPGSCGGSVFHLTLLPLSPAPLHWQAGDIAEVIPYNAPETVSAWLQTLGLSGDEWVEIAGERDTLLNALTRSHLPLPHNAQGLSAQAVAQTLRPLSHREYSIASLPTEGSLQLLLRRVTRSDGTPGVCSSWLCDHLALHDEVELRIRSNPNFHPPEPSRPMILIGNGTGIAGLRGHLKARVASAAHRNWLLFGERSLRRDFFFREEIECWHSQGAIERLDLAFSRDQPERVYVQHKLREQAEELRRWVDEGAAVYVCGSLVGMAPAVDDVLRQVLGNDRVQQMLASGRYRRDVY